MKKLFLFLFALLCSYHINAQNTPIYTWPEHLSYQISKLILEVENNIYCATENGLYYYNKNDYTKITENQQQIFENIENVVFQRSDRLRKSSAALGRSEI